MKISKMFLGIILFAFIIGFGFIRVNLLNTNFYDYNKNRINEKQFTELIKEFDEEFKGQLTDESLIRTYKNKDKDLILESGKYEITLLDNEFIEWILAIINNIKQGFYNFINNAFS